MPLLVFVHYLHKILYSVIHFKKYFTKTTDAWREINVLCTDGKKISQSSDIDDLKRRNTEAVATVTCEMLRRMWEELYYRSDICRVTRGAYIECL
jgi:hypothetical protein